MSEIRLVMEQMGPDSGEPPINASFTQVIPAKRSGEEVAPRSFAIVHTDDRDINKGFLLQVIQIAGLGVDHTDLGISIYARTFFQRALAAGNGEIISFQPLHGDRACSSALWRYHFHCARCRDCTGSCDMPKLAGLKKSCMHVRHSCSS